jgi:hypothetical protein
MKVVSVRAFIRPKPISSMLHAVDLSEIEVNDEPVESFARDKVSALFPLIGWSSSRLTE